MSIIFLLRLSNFVPGGKKPRIIAEKLRKSIGCFGHENMGIIEKNFKNETYVFLKMSNIYNLPGVKDE